jgi:predicted SprT family Zn-dependent metalloprotease
MARLRKPSPNEPTTFAPPSATNATRTSPRKATRSQCYATSSDSEGDAVLVPKTTKRESRNAKPLSQDAPDVFAIPRTATASDALTPRKQRILRPVESNSRLLRKLSNETLATSEKRQRERRVGSGTTDVDVGKKTNLMYARTLAKSVVKKQARRAKIDVVGETELREPVRQRWREKEATGDNIPEVEAEEEAETSLLCGEEEDLSQEEDIAQESSESDEDEDPVVLGRQRQRQPQPRRLESESEDEESDHSVQLPIPRQASTSIAQQRTEEPPLTSMRPPHKKGHSTNSDWAQEVIDLTSSPEAPSSFVAPALQLPSRVRSASFASSRPQTSSSNGGLAVLKYSPTPTKHRSPCKAPPLVRPGTPPLAPTSPSKLVSPSKKRPTIPKAPDLRPSLDAFWNPEVVNEWNEQHSPSKPLVSPRKQKWRDDMVKMMESIDLEDSGDSDEDAPSPTISPRESQPSIQLRSPTKKPTPIPTSDPSVKDIRAARKDFSARKHALAAAFLLELDTTICNGRIAALTTLTGGIKLVWSRTLKTTAGRANWKREQIRIRTGPLPSDFRIEVRQHCSIELAEKVIDDIDRLYNVLAHEFCHLTTFMISDVRNNPHGAEFKSWGRKATALFGDKGVEVTTKHSYAIEYKFVWECVSCGYEFKRHSKSVDVKRHSCGKCKGALVQTKPKPRVTGVVRSEGKSEYQNYVKAHFSRVKKGLVDKGLDAQMGKVMEGVAKEYREMKAKKGKVGTAGLEDALMGLKI